jgi:CYTH domain-containing protein
VPFEIERKFLVEGEPWRSAERSTVIRQNYLSTIKDVSIRLRLRGEKATLTIKGEREGAVREEFEYAIPAADAETLLGLCPYPEIEKRRYEIVHEGHIWEVDVFSGRLQGLVLAEIELRSEDESFRRPTWLGVEVTADPRFRNSRLVQIASLADLLLPSGALAEP